MKYDYICTKTLFPDFVIMSNLTTSDFVSCIGYSNAQMLSTRMLQDFVFYNKRIGRGSNVYDYIFYKKCVELNQDVFFIQSVREEETKSVVIRCVVSKYAFEFYDYSWSLVFISTFVKTKLLGHTHNIQPFSTLINKIYKNLYHEQWMSLKAFNGLKTKSLFLIPQTNEYLSMSTSTNDKYGLLCIDKNQCQ